MVTTIDGIELAEASNAALLKRSPIGQCGRTRFSLSISLMVGLIALPVHTLCAQPLSDQYAAVKKRLGVWNDQPSPDTTPISFSIDDVHYTVPRNYITWMDDWGGGPQTLVRFKADFPGFQPFSERTRVCMTAAPANRPAGCVPFEFILRRGGGDPTDDEGFGNARKLFHSQNPLPAPFGFELYETGPAEARINTYRKLTREHTLIIQCFLPPQGVQHAWVCSNHSRLPDGNVLEYHLYGDQLELAERVDEGSRHLIASFTPKAGVH